MIIFSPILYRFFYIMSIVSLIGSILTFIIYMINRPTPIKIPSPIPQPEIPPSKTEILPHEMQKMAEIHIYFDNKLYKTYPITHRSYIIGREGDIKTPDEDIYVSRKQLQLIVDSVNKIYYLYLLPSKNPVYINDKRFGFDIKSPYILRDGDKIKVGNRISLLFRKII
ncbi:MAG: FHA domain-containing protein [Caldisericia bacterium]|nr:FHA domain-containing protein [Caldisericia bacterium]